MIEYIYFINNHRGRGRWTQLGRMARGANIINEEMEWLDLNCQPSSSNPWRVSIIASVATTMFVRGDVGYDECAATWAAAELGVVTTKLLDDWFSRRSPPQFDVTTLLEKHCGN